MSSRYHPASLRVSAQPQDLTTGQGGSFTGASRLSLRTWGSFGQQLRGDLRRCHRSGLRLSPARFACAIRVLVPFTEFTPVSLLPCGRLLQLRIPCHRFAIVAPRDPQNSFLCCQQGLADLGAMSHMNHKIAPGGVAAGVIVAASLFMAQAAWAVFDSATVPTDSNLKVVRVVPEGDEVPPLRQQIVVTFDRPGVAIGQMTLSAADSPVTISPSVSCQWHWLDPRSLACELNAAQALAPAARYTVTVAAGITAQDGGRLDNQDPRAVTPD